MISLPSNYVYLRGYLYMHIYTTASRVVHDGFHGTECLKCTCVFAEKKAHDTLQSMLDKVHKPFLQSCTRLQYIILTLIC